MSEADRLAIVVFFVIVAGGGLCWAAWTWLRKSESERTRERLLKFAAGPGVPVDPEAVAATARAHREMRRQRLRESMGWLGVRLAHLEAVAGRRGVRLFLVATVGVFMLTLMINLLVLRLPWWIEMLWGTAFTAAIATLIQRMLEERFRSAFLAQLPDILDTITRASQAGIPIAQAVRTIGETYEWPAGREFRRIAEGFQLGNDMTAVLDEAELRIRLPDFSFLTVCLELQQETGGSMSVALSNLATVIRERRDLRLKARALTAEARLTSKVISAIPFAMIGFMWFTSPDYIGVLFNTEAGRLILSVAAGLLITGLFLVNRLSKLRA